MEVIFSVCRLLSVSMRFSFSLHFLLFSTSFMLISTINSFCSVLHLVFPLFLLLHFPPSISLSLFLPFFLSMVYHHPCHSYAQCYTACFSNRIVHYLTVCSSKYSCWTFYFPFCFHLIQKWGGKEQIRKKREALRKKGWLERQKKVHKERQYRSIVIREGAFPSLHFCDVSSVDCPC